MKRKFIIFLKRHPVFLNFIWLCARFFLRIISIFIKVNEKRIIFSSFGGRKYDDSPKALYEKMIQDDFFKDYEFVWSFEKPENFQIIKGIKVKIDSFSFFVKLLSSKVWIDNSGIDRGIGFKKKGTIHIQTWHGAPLKKICGEENSGSMSKKKPKKDDNTIYCSQSSFDKEIFARVFNTDYEHILDSDLPRNDQLAALTNENDILNIKSKLGINDKKVILYMPTYREYLSTKNNELYIKPPIHIDQWKKMLGNEYVLLIRAHYAVTKSLEIVDDNFVKDVSNYPYLNELYLISNVLISDYSSAFFDYSILGRPMFCFAYDYEEYSLKRGLYVELKNTLPCSINKNENELINSILNMNYDEECNRVKEFSKKYVPYSGNSCNIVVKKLKSMLNVD